MALSRIRQISMKVVNQFGDSLPCCDTLRHIVEFWGCNFHDRPHTLQSITRLCTFNSKTSAQYYIHEPTANLQIKSFAEDICWQYQVLTSLWGTRRKDTFVFFNDSGHEEKVWVGGSWCWNYIERSITGSIREVPCNCKIPNLPFYGASCQLRWSGAYFLFRKVE